jgi:hypothetical protein
MGNHFLVGIQVRVLVGAASYQKTRGDEAGVVVALGVAV